MDKNNSAWKACMPQKGIGGSNPPHSATNAPNSKDSPQGDQCVIRGQKASKWGEKTAKQPHRMRKVRVSLYFRPTYDKQGTAPLLVAVNHASSSCYIPIMGVRLKAGQWDKVRKKVVNHPQADTINSVATTTLGKANEAVMRLGSVRGMTTAQVRDEIAEYIYPPKGEDTSVLGVFEKYKAKQTKPNTADKFTWTMRHIRQFVGGGAGRLRFSDITPDWLAEFDGYLVPSCPSPNSRAIHMRNIRTIFNHALDHGLTTAAYPFRKFVIKTAPSNPTPLTLEQLRKLWMYVPKIAGQRYWLDLWRLMFCLIGINMADLTRLVKVSQGRINYTRQKTGRLYSIKVEPQAAALIAAHRGRVWLLDILDHYKSVHNALGTANKNLKRIAEDLGLPPITTYTARYTWATLAASIDTPIEVISQALGHTYGQAVTLGYIMPDRRKVDEANKAVLALLSGTDSAK